MAEQSTESGVFAHLVQRALEGAVTPERVRAKVEAHVEKLVDESISDAMRSWSGTGKAVRDALTGALQVNDLDLPSYGHVVCQILERQIQARVSEVVAAKLQEDMEGLLSLAPKRVKLSKLIADLLGDEDDDPCGCDPTEIGLELDIEHGETVGWVTITAKDAPGRYSDADIKLLVRLAHKRGEEPEVESSPGWRRRENPLATISCGHVSGSDLKKDIRFGWGTDYAKARTEFGRWFAFEQKVLSMYATGTVIELDEDACVLNGWD